MFKSMFSVAGTLLLASSVSAATASKCPDIDALKAEGLSNAQAMSQTEFMVYNMSTYETKNNWVFAIAPVAADSNEEAIESANQILNDINSPGQPTQQGGYFACRYESGVKGVEALALRDDMFISPAQLKQLLNKAH